jgi:hypothetical protein
MTKQSTRDLILWCSVLAGPIFWLVSFQAKFSWVPIACASQTNMTLLLFSVLAFICTAGAGLLAWRQWRGLGKQQPGESSDMRSRSRFMALGGVFFSAGFCVVILAQTIPDLILGSCQ